MYYKENSSKVFWVSFITAFLVSALVSIGVLYFAPDFLPGKKMQVIEVPDVENLTLENAQMMADKKGLSLVVEDRRNDATVKENRVIYQKPSGGEEVKKGSIIRVIVSKGPEKEEKKPEEEIIIPDVSGFESNQAKVYLAEKGLTAGEIKKETSEKEEGIVLRTVPEAGKKVTSDVIIDLIISSGPGKVEVPRITRKTVSRARSILQNSELELGNINEITSPEYPFDIIISQDPKPGEKIRVGSKVNVTVNREAG